MTRFSDSANQTAAGQPHVFICCMVHLDFASGDLYVHDGQGTFSWNSVDWVGTGEFGAISIIEESQDDRPKGIKLSLSGIDSEIMAAAMAENVYGRSCKIYLAFFNESGALLADPELEYEGRMDSVRADLSENAANIELTVESRLILWSHTNGANYTDEDQQATFSGDLFFDQQTSQADQYLNWGQLVRGGGTSSDPGYPVRERV